MRVAACAMARCSGVCTAISTEAAKSFVRRAMMTWESAITCSGCTAHAHQHSPKSTLQCKTSSFLVSMHTHRHCRLHHCTAAPSMGLPLAVLAFHHGHKPRASNHESTAFRWLRVSLSLESRLNHCPTLVRFAIHKTTGSFTDSIDQSTTNSK